MAVIKTYSKRLEELQGGGNRPLIYELSPSLRTQIAMIADDVLGPPSAMAHRPDPWAHIRAEVLRERGARSLSFIELQRPPVDEREDVVLAIQIDRVVEHVLDLVERIFIYALENFSDVPVNGGAYLGIKLHPTDAIEELNQRFREAGVGYSFESGKIIRADSQYLHTEAVVPALALLGDRAFTGAEGEFLSAHDNYRRGKFREAIQLAGSAFESVMQTILAGKPGLTGKENASQLVALLEKNGVLAPFLANGFQQATSLLISLATVRNQPGHGHGAGAAPVDVSQEIAAYALHLLASNTVLLIRLHGGRAATKT